MRRTIGKITDKKATLYRYHPKTGQDAEEFTDVAPELWTTEAREALAKERQHGAQFYWTNWQEADGEYTRCEYANIKFVLDVFGVTIELVTEKPH